MNLNKAGKRKWRVRKEALGFYFIAVINFWMAFYELVAPMYIKHRMTYEGYDLLFPVIIGLPWVIIAIIQKDKWVWLRSIVVVLGAYGARTLTVSLAYGRFRMEIERLLFKYFHTGITFRVDWIVNVLYLVLITLVAFWIYADEIKRNSKSKQKVTKDTNEVKKEQASPTPAAVLTKEKFEEQIHSIKEDKIIEPKNVETPPLLDVNRCSEEEFLSLPGMSLLSAKKAVEEREIRGAYRSFDDFVNRNGIKPHFMVQMQALVTVKDIGDAVTHNKVKKGRMLDV